MRGVLWHESRLSRVQTCGRWSIRPDGAVEVRKRGEAVGYAGLATCGSVWACPVCNARIQSFRRLEVTTALGVALRGGSVAFGAYTLQHGPRTDLRDLWKHLSYCWQSVTRDKSVRRVRAELGHVGILRAAEVTHGAAGWHPHLHPAHVFDRPVTASDVAALHAAQLRAWGAAARRRGLTAPAEQAQHLHKVTTDASTVLGDYFTKASVGWELTSTQTKTRTRATSSRTPWEILRSVYTTGDADDLDLWHAWEKGSKGMRALTWSRGLRTRLGLDTEQTDDQVADQTIGTSEDAGFLVTDWSPIAHNSRLGADLLSLVQRFGWQAGRHFCAEHSIPTQEA